MDGAEDQASRAAASMDGDHGGATSDTLGPLNSRRAPRDQKLAAVASVLVLQSRVSHRATPTDNVLSAAGEVTHLINGLFETFDDRDDAVSEGEPRLSCVWVRKRAPHLLATILLVFCYVTIGAMFYVRVESGTEVASGELQGGWSTVDSVYFCFVTMSLVGCRPRAPPLTSRPSPLAPHLSPLTSHPSLSLLQL